MTQIEKGKPNEWEAEKKQLSTKEMIESIKDQWRTIESHILASSGRIENMYMGQNSNEEMQISTTLRMQLERMWVKVPEVTSIYAKDLFELIKDTLEEQLASEIREIDGEKQAAIETVLLETRNELTSLKTGTLISVLNLLHQNKNSGYSITPNNRIIVPLYNYK